MPDEQDTTENTSTDQPSRRMFLAFGVAGAATGVWSRYSSAQGRGRRGPPVGGPGRGRGRRGRGRGDERFEADHNAIQTLLSNRDKIHRQVTNLPNGVETLTETDDDGLRSVLIEHVEAMSDRLEEGRPIHQRDPLFAEIFRHRKHIELQSEFTERGIKVTETSEDPQVAKLIQRHAEVVSLFLKNGHAEVRKNHEVPQ